MSDFHELRPPTESRGDKWVVISKDDIFLILSINRELVYGPSAREDEYLFDTEKDAHFAAAGYYNQSRVRTYPYIDVMMTTLDEDDTTSKQTQSRRMEFI